MKSQLVSFAKLLFGWPLSFLALFFIGKTIVSQGDIFNRITSINVWFLFLAIVCFFLYYFIRSYIWKELLAYNNHHIPLKTSNWLWAVSELKRFIPGNVWSFLGRVVLFAEKGVPKKLTGHLLFVEIEIFLLGCIAVSFFAIPFIFNYLIPQNQPQIIILLPFIVLTTTLCIGIFGKNLLRGIKNKKTRYFVDFLFILPPKQMGYVVILSTLAVFFFGLGTFFSIQSILFLHLKDILGFTGYFVVALLVGYVSIITPMGLGVREGVITFGLTPFLGVGAAAFVSIFSRIIQTISDIVFLGVSYFWQKSKSVWIAKLEQFISSHKQEVLLGIGIALYILYFTTASFLRFENFHTGRFDLGNMDQTVWNSLHGHLFEFTDPDGLDSISRLSYHADGILILLAPFYLLWSHVKILLLIQTVTLALGAYYVYAITISVLKNKNAAVVLGLLYLINPSVQFVNLYDFHPVALATTFLLGAFYYLLKEKKLLFFLFLILAALTKEQVWIVCGMMSIAASLAWGKKLIPVFFALLSFFLFYLLLWQVIPSARGGEHFALEYLEEFGNTPTQVVTTAITSPDKILGILLEEERRKYIYYMFSPLGYLSLFSPHILILAAPDLAINILSNNKQLHQIYYQYTSVITPFLFIAAIYTLRLVKWFGDYRAFTIVLMYSTVASLHAAYDFGPLPFSKRPNIDMFVKQLPYSTSVQKVLTTIPNDASVAATNNLGAHLSQRRTLSTIPIGTFETDYVVFLLTDSFAQPSLDAQRQMVSRLKRNDNYQLLYEEKEFFLFKRVHSNAST